MLVVDDSPSVRDLLKEILVRGSHTIVGEAADGEEAIKKYMELKPELVLMDVIMVDVDGIDATRRIIEYDPNAKIILFSGLGQPDMVNDAIKAGAKDYITKPLNPLMIREMVKRVLGL